MLETRLEIERNQEKLVKKQGYDEFKILVDDMVNWSVYGRKLNVVKR